MSSLRTDRSTRFATPLLIGALHLFVIKIHQFLHSLQLLVLFATDRKRYLLCFAAAEGSNRPGISVLLQGNNPTTRPQAAERGILLLSDRPRQGLFSLCTCLNPGWSGIDCSMTLTTPASLKHGLIPVRGRGICFAPCSNVGIFL
jgi:hypothetical protein